MTLGWVLRLIRILAHAVPAADRGRWREEWLAEIQEIARMRGTRTAARVALGAAPDAVALRRLAASRARMHTPARGRFVRRTGLSLDLKLALRMLMRYPGLTAISTAGMAVGIAIAAGAFAIMYTIVDPALPFDDGDRIVTIQTWDAGANRPQRRVLHDVIAWRDVLTTVADVGAFRQVGRNLIAPGRQPETIRVAEMSAAGFRVTRVPPVIGRYLLEDDEAAGAPPVVVIGYDVWLQRFGGDHRVLGQPVQLGDTTYAVVGVMPEGYRFPVNHQFWVSLRLDAAAYQRLRGPDLTVFGRLAPAASLDQADAELHAFGQRAAQAFPETHAQLRPRVLPYTFPFFDMNDPETAWVAHLVVGCIALVLAIVCVNVAILVYARTATRQGEIAIRSALGASRSRIVGQLFVEALALTVAAGALGLIATAAGLRQINAAMAVAFQQIPFWWTFRLTPGLIAYIVVLSVAAAAIIGVVPALKATGRRVQGRLQGLSAGGGARMRLGRTWTALVVVQVACAVALLPATVFHAWDSLRFSETDPRFEEILTTVLVVDGPAPPVATPSRERGSRYASQYAELARRLEVEPSVAAVTFASNIPGEEPRAWVEVEGIASPADEESNGGGYALGAGTRAGHAVGVSRVDPDLFPTLEVAVLTGRQFHAADTAASAQAVIVNRSFVDQVLGGGDPLGRRVRYVGRSRESANDNLELWRWYEIAGVIADFPRASRSELAVPKMYHAATPDAIRPVSLLIRLNGTTPAAFVGSLRRAAADVDSTLQLRDPLSMHDALRRDLGMLRVAAAVLTGLTLAVLLLSSAGIYALMSIAVSQRRREIGIRAALGAEPRRILASVFGRALRQLAMGAALGVAIAALLEQATGGELMRGHGAVILPLVAVFMTGVGLLAALGPAREGLRIDPTEALRED